MAKGKVYTIQITGLAADDYWFGEQRQSDANTEWGDTLRDARNNKAEACVICQCMGKNEDHSLRRLVVRYRTDTDKFYLSAWQFTGGQHRHDCRFYSIWQDKSSAKAYSPGVVTVNSEGLFCIKLPVGLIRKNPGDEPVQNVNPARHPRTGKAKPSMSLLGLGHFIWQQAEINTWRPQFVRNKPRNALWIASRINRTADNIQAGSVRLSDVFLVSASKESVQHRENKEQVRDATQNNKRMVAVALLKRDAIEGYAELLAGHLKLSSPFGFPALRVSPAVLKGCERSFQTELNAWRAGHKVVAIIETEPPVLHFEKRDGRVIPVNEADVIGIALMRVSPRFIPVDSGYEEIIETRLCEQERSFVKPLRFDADDDTLPDFWLTDTDGERSLPMEVFGMRTPDYIARRDDKITLYNDKYSAQGWWFWDATARDAENNITTFPPKAGDGSDV